MRLSWKIVFTWMIISVCLTLKAFITVNFPEEVLREQVQPSIQLAQSSGHADVENNLDHASPQILGKVATTLLNSNCPDTRRPTKESIRYKNKHWQVLQESDEEVFIISAFFDDRPVVGSLPLIRLLAVSLPVKHILYCQVWYENYEHPYVSQVSILKTGRGDKIDGVKYDQSLYTCELPAKTPVPSYVSLSTESCGNSTMYVPIFVPKQADLEHEFGVCVAIAFGRIPTEQFVEWMELNRMFGVTEFSIYDGNISSDMNKLFQYYHNQGVLQLHDMPPPVNDFSKKGVKLSSPASLNDCMMRNIYKYRYVVVIDFDEFIFPKYHDNYTAMLRDINVNEGTSYQKSYTFRNEYYFDHFPQDPFQPKYLKTMRFRSHTPVSKYLYAPKSFIDPKMCLSVFNHYCYKRFTKEKQFTLDVPTKFATSHHYRTCGFDKNKCAELSKTPEVEDYVLRFKKALDARVQNVFKKLGENL